MLSELDFYPFASDAVPSVGGGASVIAWLEPSS